MYNRIFILNIFLIAGLLLTNSISYSYDFAFEAENADTIEAPMVIADDENASGGQFIWMPGERATGGGGEGWAEYIINLPEAGTYALWAKVIAWDGNSDSFWVNWLPADPDENPQETNNNDFRWAVAGGSDWHWDRINRRTDNDGTFDAMWEQSAGETRLRIAVREDAAMLDVIYITDNLSGDEAEVSPRDPGPEDLLTPVEPQEKLTTTWGKLKLQR